MWSVKRVVVCLCGSTKFKDEFVSANLRETLQGHIVLSIGCDVKTDDDIFGAMSAVEQSRVKQELDALHLDKIKLADRVLCLNKDGYIGASTTREIYFALLMGKRIEWLEPQRASETMAKVDAFRLEAVHDEILKGAL